MAFPEFPTAADVEALIRHQYSDAEYEEILNLLCPINSSGEAVGWTAARIQLAALAMSNGNKSLIRQYIEQGNTDARDLQLMVHGQLGPTWERDCLFQINRRG